MTTNTDHLDWYEIRLGFAADSLEQVGDLLDDMLPLLPYQGSFVACFGVSDSLSRGEGFSDDMAQQREGVA